MNQLLSVVEDKIVIDKVRLNKTEGNVGHFGDFTVHGNVNLNKNLTVAGEITVDTLHVKNLTSENSGSTDSGQWTANLEDNLIGKGFSWTWGEGRVELSYQTGNRITVSGGNLDLSPTSSYRIDNTEVITLNALGPTVTKSNLKELGSLKSLNVIGDTLLGEFAYFNSGFNRLGLNTEEPNGTLSIVENDVELVIKSPNYGKGQIGTYTTHDLSIVTDNTDRITIKNDGKVIFGDAATKTANVTIYGTLNVETLVADTRVERFSSLEIKASRDTNIYGKGIIWSGVGDPRQFVILSGPDRFWSTESIDLKEGQSYFINNRVVLTDSALGEGIVSSRLTSVGALESLTVTGEAKLLHTLTVDRKISSPELSISKDDKTLAIIGTTLNSNSNVSFKVLEDEAFYADSNEISIGNKNNSRKIVKLFGPVSIGIANPAGDADLEIKGNIKFSGKKFVVGAAEPTEGEFNKGDICWNENPVLHGYVGWICTASGTPGTWIPFGAIGR